MSGVPVVLTNAPETAWMARGACLGARRHVTFFPVCENPAESQAARDALTYCAVCPVRTTCLDWATARGEEGIWGGTTTRQRTAARRALTAPSRPVPGPDRCGSDAGYMRHRRAEEPTCEACRVAHNKVRAEAKRLRRKESKALREMRMG